MPLFKCLSKEKTLHYIGLINIDIKGFRAVLVCSYYLSIVLAYMVHSVPCKLSLVLSSYMAAAALVLFLFGLFCVPFL